MKIIEKWKSKNPIQINAISVDPINNKIIVGVGRVIVFFDAITGKELGHCEQNLMDIVYHLEKMEKFLRVEEKYNLVYIWNTGDISKSMNKKHLNILLLEWNIILV